ncbi:MAG: hypothetical protein A2161_08830 [Candidatus Schekmanbacteria bacterium RBG_13_48_7]|uniref:Alanine--tRNA ligase n=1 Tax=Candidatus Schekmanbacteria bacterium RBG_13_48_7 TaxID=1817878 RepID=A0A1F7RM10_9BACT|nr:MAG: hypothetical protein A2161_08830 [Candidatus Schekmanbacteria bacterium RBG_13_48_7]
MPEQKERIRVVSMGDFDHSACGGTHVKNTSRVGIIKIVKQEKYKTNIRIYFCCGIRALRDYQKKHDVLIELSQSLTAGWEDIHEICQKMKKENLSLIKKQNELKDQLIPVEAESLLQEADRTGEIILVQRLFNDKSRDEINKLVGYLMKSKQSIIMLATLVDAKIHVVFAKGKEIPLDMRLYLKYFLDQIDGKGGGRPEMAQGGGTGTDKIPELFTELKNMIFNDLKK